MSTGSIKVVSALDPQLEVKDNLEWGVLRGPSNAIWKEYKNTTQSDTSMDFNCQPPNSNVYLSPYVMIETDINVDVSCPDALYLAAGSPAFLLNIGTTDALRSYPLSSCVQAMNVTLNSSTISTALDGYVAEYMRYVPDLAAQRKSVQPTMRDNSQKYVDYNGTVFNPLGDYRSSTPGMIGRGFYKPTNTPQPPQTVNGLYHQYYKFKITENIVISPFMFNDKPSSQALFGLQNFGIALTFGKLERMFSHMDLGNPSIQPPYYTPLAAGLKITPTFNSLPTIGNLTELGVVQDGRALVSWMSPNVTQVVPRTNMYPYYQHIANNTAIKYTGAGINDETQFTTQAISLRVIPNRIFVYIKKKKGTLTAADADSYEFIKKCSVNFDTLEGIFSSASSTQIYQMSADNGLVDTYPEVKDHVGSVLCFSFGSQIALPPGLAPGVSGTFTLSLNITMKRVALDAKNTTAVDLDCVVLTETSGVLQIFDDNSIINTGVVSMKQVLEAANSGVSYDQLSADSSAAVSGGFGVGSLIKKAAPIARAVVDGLEATAPFFGEGMGMRGSAKLGGDLIKSSGGAMLSKAQLKRLAQQ